MTKRPYNFGLKYLTKLTPGYSYLVGFYVRDHYTYWLLDCKVTNE